MNDNTAKAGIILIALIVGLVASMYPTVRSWNDEE